MTRRSMQAGLAPTIIIKAGASVTVDGWDSEQLLAESTDHSMVSVRRRSEAEVARARAAVGDRELFDLRLKRRARPDDREDAIEVKIGGEGRVSLPAGSLLKVYAGSDVMVSGVQGELSVVAGKNLTVRQARTLVHASAGGTLDVACERTAGDELRLEAGRDLRCYIRDLPGARLIVSDIGGAWEGLIGDGALTLRLKAGGEAVLVTDQPVQTLPPDHMLGQIERPDL